MHQNNQITTKLAKYHVTRFNTDFEGKIMTKREYINHKRFHSHLSHSHSHPIPIILSNLIPMVIPREGWESRISHAYL